MSVEYFTERQHQASAGLLACSAVEAAVSQDIRRLINHIAYLPHGVIVTSAYLLEVASVNDHGATDYYNRTRSSRLLNALADLYTGLDVPEMLRELTMQPTPINGIDETGQVVIHLANGYELRSGWCDKDDPDRLPAGDYVSIIDAQGEQVFYGDSADLFSDPVQSRRSLYSIIQVCCGGRV